jgi:L-amino acid N-acyltransferase YncA
MQIRKFRAEDLEAVLDIHMFAFSEHINVLLGRKYNREMLRWFMNENCVYFVAVDENDKVIGYVFGAPWGYQQRMNRDLVKLAAVEMLKRPWIFFNKKLFRIVWIRLKTLLGINKMLTTTEKLYPGKIISMVGMGIAKGTLRKGIGVALYEAALDEARKLGYNYSRGTVNKTNMRSRGMHEKIGFQKEEAPPDLPTIGYYIKLQ